MFVHHDDWQLESLIDERGSWWRIRSPNGQDAFVALPHDRRHIVLGLDAFINDQEPWIFDVVPDSAACSEQLCIRTGSPSELVHQSPNLTVLQVMSSAEGNDQ